MIFIYKMRRKLTSFMLFCGFVVTVLIYFNASPSKNNHLLHSTSNTEETDEKVQVQHIDDDSHKVEEHVKADCKIKRPTPLNKISQIALRYINQITNCPCNVDYVNEENLLCATTETLANVREKSELKFIPETLSPCVFADKDGDNYWLSHNNSEQDRKDRFLHSPSTSQLLCLPSLFLLGVAKSGTTSLHASLAQHQSIRETQRKEMSFWNGGGFWEEKAFMDDNNNTRYNLFAYMSLSREIAKTMSTNIKDKLKAKSAKPVQDTTLILDSSPGNCMAMPFKKILGFIPNVKALLIMREPGDRVFSFYRFSAQVQDSKDNPFYQNQTPKGFHKYVTHAISKSGADAFIGSKYHVRVRELLDLISRKDMVFIQYEEFIRDPVGVIERDILPVLSLEPFTEDTKKKVLQNKRTNPSQRTYKMLPETRTLLQNHLREYNQQLSVLLDDPKWTWGY